MNLSRYKYIFLIFGSIYLLDGFFTLFSNLHKPYEFFGISITKNQETLRQFITALTLLLAYWKFKNK